MEMEMPSRRLPPQRAIHGAIESAVVLQQMRQMQVPVVRTVTSSDEAMSDDAQSDKNTEEKSRSSKKRKPTYYMRKEEMAQLQEEMELLKEKLRKLEKENPGRAAPVKLMTVMEKNDALRQRVKQCGAAMAAAQSLVASHGPRSFQSPVGCYIHLTKDPLERQRTLSALTMEKMREATAFILARSQFIDVSKTSRQMDAYESVTGDYTSVHWEVTPLEEALSVRHAFDELTHYSETQEISMTEKLGVMTIRESDSDQAGGAHHVRMLSQFDNGITVETHVGAFTHYFERSDLLDRPHALHVVDSIDEDELFPYLTQTRMRKDVSAIVMITECPHGTKHPDGRPVVTMIRWAFTKLYRSEFTDQRDLDFVAREGVSKWCDVMLRCVRERLSSSNSHGSSSRGGRHVV